MTMVYVAMGCLGLGSVVGLFYGVVLTQHGRQEELRDAFRAGMYWGAMRQRKPPGGPVAWDGLAPDEEEVELGWWSAN